MKTIGFILCAGFGTRLGTLTENCPKPLLKVGGKALLDYEIENMKRAGISHIFFNLHYLADQIKHFVGDGSQWGITPYFSYEASPLGTAGALLNVFNQFGDASSILCQYGDVLTNTDLKAFIDFHYGKAAQISLMTHLREKSNSVVLTNPSGQVTQFLERPTEQEILQQKIHSPYEVNSGIYLIQKEALLPFLPLTSSVDFPKDIFPKILAQKQLYAFPLNGYRIAIDSPERLEKANTDLANNKDFFKPPLL